MNIMFMSVDVDTVDERPTLVHKLWRHADSWTTWWSVWFFLSNFSLVSVFENPNWTEAKRSNSKFRFPWLFSKPNLSHTNSQYLSHSHKTSSCYGHCRTDSKWSWNQIISRHHAIMHAFEPIEHLENHRPKCKMHTQETQPTRFFCILQLIYKKTEPNQRFFKTEPKPTRTRSFLETEPNLKNPFRTSLVGVKCTQLLA